MKETSGNNTLSSQAKQYYQNDPRSRPTIQQISNSFQARNQPAMHSSGFYRKQSFNRGMQNQQKSINTLRTDERKSYDTYGGYNSARSSLENPSVQHNSYENQNSNRQSYKRQTIFDNNASTIKRESSIPYQTQATNVNLQKSFQARTMTSSMIQPNQYYPSNSSSFLNQPPIKKEPLPGGIPSSFLQQKMKYVEQQPYFQYVLRYSYRSKRGIAPKNPQKPNQDAFVTIPNINNKTFLHYFGVCDGHGEKGHFVSNFIKKSLPAAVGKIKNLNNPQNQLMQAYKSITIDLDEDLSIDTTYSGSTSVGIFLNHNKLYCCNVGDSRAILGQKGKNGQWKAKDLSIDHKPSLQRQANRIKIAGGRIDAYKDSNGDQIGPLRVWFKDKNIPGLAMTRSFGDTIASPIGVVSTPQITQHTLNTQDKIIVIASDGLWQFIQSNQVIQLLSTFYNQNKIEESCNKLLQLTTGKWKQKSVGMDDITFVVLFLDYSLDKNL